MRSLCAGSERGRADTIAAPRRVKEEVESGGEKTEASRREGLEGDGGVRDTEETSWDSSVNGGEWWGRRVVMGRCGWGVRGMGKLRY